jgi:dihydropteroate synthase
VPVCLMHMQGEPRTMQADPQYDDVVSEVRTFLRRRVGACEQAGIPPERILLDPGFGFGKSTQHNLHLLAGLETIGALGFPLVVGLSRKSMIGKLLGLEVADRLPASIALAVLAVERGATLVRTHDVAATWQALQMSVALRSVS